MSSATTRPLPGTTIDPLYPDSDGQPLGETDFHNCARNLLQAALQDYFADTPDVYVGSNLLLYYEQGNSAARREPDVFVARGVGNHLRRSFRTWEEGTAPQVMFEIASEKTWREDLGEKRELYGQLGVREYFLFDPEGRFLQPVLQGFRYEGETPVPLTPAEDGSLESVELGLRVVSEYRMLRLIDVHTGQPVLTPWEQAEERRQRAEEEHQRAEEAERRAEEEHQRAEEAERRAEEEHQRAEQLAAEVARLQALLRDRPPS